MTAAFLIALACAVWFAIGWLRAAGECNRLLLEMAWLRYSKQTTIVYGGPDLSAEDRVRKALEMGRAFGTVKRPERN